MFITDSILALLMASQRTVYSWDTIVKKDGSKLFFDKRDGSNIDNITVNENVQEPPIDSHSLDPNNINNAHNLAKEAAVINWSFTNQITTQVTFVFIT